MAYEPKTWECGETITADALNHIEQGIAQSGGGSEPLILTSHIEQQGTRTCSVLDHTYNEIKAALEAGRLVLCGDGSGGYGTINSILVSEGVYALIVQLPNLSEGQMVLNTFAAESADDYLKFCMGAG